MADWKKVVIESAAGQIAQQAATATALHNTRQFSATGDVTATAQNFNGTGNVALPMVLSNTAITGQTAKTSGADDDLLLIADSAASNALKKITRANFISGLGAGTMSSWTIDVDTSGSGYGVNDAETVDFLSGTGAGFVLGGTATAPTITVNSVDSEIVHDNLSGFVADEHIAHSGVSITAGAGLTGGGTIAASRTINVGAGSYITVAADTVSVDATNANTASKVVARDASGNFSAGTITADLVGDVTGNADTATTATSATTATTATNANNVNLADESTDTTCFVTFATDATGNRALKTGTNLTFNSNTGTLTATGFIGNLTGDVTGTAATATNSTNSVNVGTAAVTSGSYKLALVPGAGGNEAVKYDAGLSWNAGTDTLTVTNLTVAGTTTTVNSSDLVVADKTIVIADGSADAATASGAGITVDVGSTAANMPELLWTDGGTLTGWSVSDYNASGNTDFPVAIMSTGSGAPSGTGAGVGSFYTDTGGNLYLYV